MSKLNKFKFYADRILETKIFEREDGEKVKRCFVRFYKHGISKNGTNFTKDLSNSFEAVLNESPVMYANHDMWEPFNRNIEEAVSFYVKGTFENREDGTYGWVEFYNEEPLSKPIFEKATKTPKHIGLSVHGYAEVDTDEDEEGNITRTPRVWQTLASNDWVINPAAGGKITLTESWKPSSIGEMLKESKEIKHKHNSEESLMSNEDLQKILEGFKDMSTENQTLLKGILESRETKITELSTAITEANDKLATVTSEKDELASKVEDGEKEIKTLKENLETVTDEKVKLETEIVETKNKSDYSAIVAEADLPEELEALISKGWFYESWVGKEKKDIEKAINEFKTATAVKGNPNPSGGDSGSDPKEGDEIEDEAIFDAMSEGGV